MKYLLALALILAAAVPAAAQETIVPGRNQLWLRDGTAASPADSYDRDRDLGRYRIGANNEGFTAGGTLRWDYNTTRLNLASGYNLVVGGNLTVTGALQLLDAALAVAVGRESLNALTSGTQVTAVGYRALYANTTGYQNVAVGDSALRSNIGGTEITAVGSGALYTATAATRSVAVGTNALYSVVTGTHNTAIGHESAYFTTASANTVVGFETLHENTTGAQNVAIGYHAMHGSGTSTPDQSVAVGDSALTNISSGDNNTAVGRAAGSLLTTGSGNTLLGREAGANLTTGSNNIIIGNAIAAAAANSSDTLNIGGLFTGNLSTGVGRVATALEIGSGPHATAGSLRLGASGGIQGRNAGGTANINIVGLDGADNIVIGNGNGQQLHLGSGMADIQWGKALVALGGGAAPTLGTIGGSGPTTAAQNSWMRVLDSTGAAFWVPVWK